MVEKHTENTLAVPIVVFAYNRPSELSEVLASLVKQDLDGVAVPDIYIFQDGRKANTNNADWHEVERLCREFSLQSSFKVFYQQSPDNKGLAASVVYGVTKVINKYGRAIVLEDDIIVVPSFYRIMVEQLEYYRDCQNVGSISGYGLKIPFKSKKYFNYFHPRPSSWGWATWADRWSKVDWNKQYSITDVALKNPISFFLAGADVGRMYRNHCKGIINSWAIRWTYFHIDGSYVCSYPYFSLCKNIGLEGTHFSGNMPFRSLTFNSKVEYKGVYINKFKALPILQANWYHSHLCKVLHKLRIACRSR